MDADDQVELFERSIRGLVAAGCGLDSRYVIPGNENSPRPSVAYATLLNRRDVPVGYPSTFAIPNHADSLKVTYWRRAEYSLQFYRKGAVHNARRFTEWVFSPPGRISVVQRGNENVAALGWGNFRPRYPLAYQRIDVIVGDAFEQRALVDLKIDYVHTAENSSDWVETVECHINVDGMILEGTVQ